jgi:hypothetical protein
VPAGNSWLNLLRSCIIVSVDGAGRPEDRQSLPIFFRTRSAGFL